jgi:hypothetical protein
MPVLGRIAAADMPTFEAQAEMHPAVARFQAFLATLAGGDNFLDLFLMCAALAHSSPFLILDVPPEIVLLR